MKCSTCSKNKHISFSYLSRYQHKFILKSNFTPKESSNESLERLIRQYSMMFDLSLPMKGCLLNQGRYLFLEGDLKYKDNICKVRNKDLTGTWQKNKIYWLFLILKPNLHDRWMFTAFFWPTFWWFASKQQRKLTAVWRYDWTNF